MPKKIAPTFYFIGNHPVLDFANTLIAVDGKPFDLLGTYSDVLRWLVIAGFLNESEASGYGREWEGAEGLTLLKAARGLRGAVATLLNARSSEQDVLQSLAFINGLLDERVVSTKLIRADAHEYVTKKEYAVRKPVDVLAPLAEAAAFFFSETERGMVKKCENPECVLYFYDQSRNSTRRWCSQKTCGNRMKVAAFLERRKQQANS